MVIKVSFREEAGGSACRTYFNPVKTCFLSNPTLTGWNVLQRSRRKKQVSIRSPVRRSVSASISIPAWEREYERDRGLVGTSYETATVEDVTSVGDGFLKISVDTAVTCTSKTYVSEGQFLFLKPWGDEDGSIEPCCFTMPPGEETMMDFFVPEVSPVGAAALAGEMLEVSEVMGEGFGPHLGSKEFQNASCVVALTIEQFCSPCLVALRNEERPTTIFVIAEREGPFAASLEKWMTNGKENRLVLFYPDEVSLLQEFQQQLERESSAAIMLSGDRNLCMKTQDVVNNLSEGRNLYTFAP